MLVTAPTPISQQFQPSDDLPASKIGTHTHSPSFTQHRSDPESRRHTLFGTPHSLKPVLPCHVHDHAPTPLLARDQHSCLCCNPNRQSIPCTILQLSPSAPLLRCKKKSAAPYLETSRIPKLGTVARTSGSAYICTISRQHTLVIIRSRLSPPSLRISHLISSLLRVFKTQSLPFASVLSSYLGLRLVT